MRIPRRGLLLLAFSFSLVGFLGEAVPAEALPSRTSCFQGYYYCMDDASQLDTFWRRAAAGMDCYVDLTTCVRDAIFG
jgi:hypothetical protein